MDHITLKTSKCLEEDIGENLCDLHVGEAFFDRTYKTKS